jgi:hypothetical protein
MKFNWQLLRKNNNTAGTSTRLYNAPLSIS